MTKIIENKSQTQTKHGGRKAAMLGGVVGLVLIIGAALLLANGLATGNSAPPPQVLNSYTKEHQNQSQARPVQVSINKINVQAQIVDLKLKVDKTLEVPKNARDVGWYVGSPAPGNNGTSVLVGHLDSWFGRAAVFANLQKLKPGDEITVILHDGSETIFVVEKSETYPQDNFPTKKVYGDTDHPSLRLITCSGQYSRTLSRYSHNMVVYANLKN